ncbi:MAG: hypothetical protein M1832_001690 [Thelocarpon impressellum]|nr:MAG: hypothetical protein M1832_001690 [Thelocarpon impressellum]
MGKKTTNFLHGLIDFPKNVWSDVHDLPADIREHGWRSRIPPLPGRGFRRRRIQDWQNQTYPYRDWPHRRKRWDELYNYQDPAEPDAQAHQSAEMNGTILPSVEGPDGSWDPHKQQTQRDRGRQLEDTQQRRFRSCFSKHVYRTPEPGAHDPGRRQRGG